MKQYSFIKMSKYWFWVIIGIVTIFSCTKMDGTYKEFLKEGAKSYPGKPETVIAHTGEYRVMLSWVVTDANVKGYKIYWNNRRDSLSGQLDKLTGQDTIRVMIENLDEAIYSFEVFNFDDNNNHSLTTELVGESLGELYASSLINRTIEEKHVENGNVYLDWNQNFEEGVLGQEVEYENNAGETIQLWSPVDNPQSVLENYKASVPFKYRTLYLPDSLAIDSFYVAYSTEEVDRKLFEVKVDRSLFSLYPLPGDFSTPNGAGNTVDKIWTNGEGIVDGGTYISKLNTHDLVQWFTIDMGASYNLTRMKLYQRGGPTVQSQINRLYAGGNLKEFEVWGSDNPDPNHNPDDHGGDFGSSWTLLATATVDRPSGNDKPAGTSRTDNAAEDIAAAEEGHEFNFDDIGSVRYIRIKGIDTWDAPTNRRFINIASIVLWHE